MESQITLYLKLKLLVISSNFDHDPCLAGAGGSHGFVSRLAPRHGPGIISGPERSQRKKRRVGTAQRRLMDYLGSLPNHFL